MLIISVQLYMQPETKPTLISSCSSQRQFCFPCYSRTWDLLMLTSSILDLKHSALQKNIQAEKSTDTYWASHGTLNAKRTNNSFFSLEKKKIRVNHHMGTEGHFYHGRLSQDISLLLFSNMIVVFAVAKIKLFQNSGPKTQALTVRLLRPT